jgi:hypothetical protein
MAGDRSAIWRAGCLSPAATTCPSFELPRAARRAAQIGAPRLKSRGFLSNQTWKQAKYAEVSRCAPIVKRLNSL